MKITKKVTYQHWIEHRPKILEELGKLELEINRTVGDHYDRDKVMAEFGERFLKELDPTFYIELAALAYECSGDKENLQKVNDIAVWMMNVFQKEANFCRQLPESWNIQRSNELHLLTAAIEMAEEKPELTIRRAVGIARQEIPTYFDTTRMIGFSPFF